MTIKKLFYFIFILSLAVFTACSSSSEPEETVDEFALVTEVGDDYVANYVSGGGNGVNITMDDLYAILTDPSQVDDVYLVDLRGSDDYNAKHIKGAVNIGLADLINKVDDGTIPDDKRVIFICYTGQTASVATSVLNLLGYDASNLKFGMCSVTSDPNVVPKSDKWQAKVDASNWYTLNKDDEGDPGEADGFPTLSTGKENAVDIIKARFDKVWDWNGDGEADWGMGVSALPDDVSNYFVLNYWSATEYADPGHIEGSYQFSPGADLLKDARLNRLPKDQKIAFYCYTGQTSAQMTAYLRVLGYEAYSVTFGVNGFGYDQMIKSTYKAPTADYSAVLE
jgi:rhodanese-related sulfurtransferase